MKVVYKHENIAVLHSVKNILDQNAIECFVKDEYGSSMSARFGIENIFHELWLKDDQDFEKAKAIIDKEIENPEPSEPWTCTGCNEENEGSFEVCWKCQTEREDS